MTWYKKGNFLSKDTRFMLRVRLYKCRPFIIEAWLLRLPDSPCFQNNTSPGGSMINDRINFYLQVIRTLAETLKNF